jgi:hypothetical protein
LRKGGVMRYGLLMLLVVVGLSLTAPAWAAQFEEIGPGEFPVAVGVGWGDYDNDGWPDLFVGGYNQGPSYPQTGPQLYHNDRDLTFTDVSQSLIPGWDTPVEQDGVAWGDYNNDGRLDLLVGSAYPMLYRHDPAGFLEDGLNAGLHITYTTGRGVAWCDYDGDNLLDAFCSNVFGPGYLLRNDGDGTFTDVSAAAGMSGGALNDQAQSASWGDFDNDGWPDLAVARNAKPTLLYRNNSDGTFTDVSVSSGISTAVDAFSAIWGDYDNDGWLDLYVTTSLYIAGEQQRDWLFHNNQNGTFTEVGDTSGLSGDDSVGVGAAWGDYDNDGRLDVFVGNFGEASFLYHNDGGGAFANVAASAGVAGSGLSGGAGWADIDRDGRLDLVQAVSDTGTRLYHNTGSGGNWLRVRALTSGTGDATAAATPTREAVGARAEVNLDNDASFPSGAPFGGTLTRLIDGGSGFCGQNEQIAHFGLGTASLVAVRVRFPDGSVVVHRGVAANQQITIADVPAGREEIFSDVPLDFWAYPQILAVKEAGIASGYLDGTYRPATAVTRDQMAVYVARALCGGDAYVPTGAHAVTFADVPSDNWAFKYVEYCHDANIVAGYWDGYHPTEVVNRAQMAVYVARSIVDPTGETGLAGYTPPSTPSFSDVATDYWAHKHIEYCRAEGVVNGYGDGTYGPENPVTRDQMAVYVARAFELPL